MRDGGHGHVRLSTIRPMGQTKPALADREPCEYPAMKNTRERVAVSVLLGILVFALVSTSSQGGNGVGAGVIVAIIVWLLTAPKEKSEKSK